MKMRTSGANMCLHTAAFTLVELLVVIAIIAILISLLLPALAQAKINSESVVCEMNLRSLAMSVIEYSEANRGASIYANYNPPYAQRTGIYWFDDLWPYMATTAPAAAHILLDPSTTQSGSYVYYIGGVNTPYEIANGADTDGYSSGPNSTVLPIFGGYGFNLAFMPNSPWYVGVYPRFTNLSTGQTTSEPVFCDAVWKDFDGFDSPSLGAIPPVDVKPNSANSWNNLTGIQRVTLARHIGGMNIGFADGHADHISDLKILWTLQWNPGSVNEENMVVFPTADGY